MSEQAVKDSETLTRRCSGCGHEPTLWNVRTIGFGTYHYKYDSTSAWESEEHAKAGDAALLEWVQANTTMKVEARFTGDFSWLEIASR